MLNVKNKVFLLVLLSIPSVSNCASGNVSLTDLDKAQDSFEEKVSKEVLIHMDLDTMFPEEGLRKLARAAGKGRTHKIEELISQGVDVNARGRGNATALFWSLKNKAGFEYLLKSGADPNVIFDDGGSVMHWLARKADCSMLQIALKYRGDPNLKAGMFLNTPIFETITVGKNEGVGQCTKVLLAGGAGIDSKDRNGKSPLLTAVDLARYDIALYLLDAGADPNLKDFSGRGIRALIDSHVDAFREGSKTLLYWTEMDRIIKKLELKGVVTNEKY